MSNITKIGIKVWLILLTTVTLAVAGSDVFWTEYQLASPSAGMGTGVVLGIKTGAKQLQGVWWSETDPRSYIEFKGNRYCPTGSFGREVGPYKFPDPCPQYFPMRVVGDTITISAGGTTARLKWKITKGKLRLFVPGVPGSQLILVKNKLPKKPTISQKPTPLEGVWKEETSGYLWRFKGNQFCPSLDFDERGLPERCGASVHMFTLTGNTIELASQSTGEPVQSGTWQWEQGRLTMVFKTPEGDTGQEQFFTKLPPLSATARGSQGVWQRSESLVLDTDTGQFRPELDSEGKGLGGTSDSYLIVQGYKICLVAERAAIGLRCRGDYELYRMEGDRLQIGQPGYEGEAEISVRQSRLEYVTSLKGTFKNVYAKTTLPSPPIESVTSG